MTRTVVDSASFSGSIGNTNTETVTVDTAGADTLLVLIDDTTEGGAPASYDYTVGVETRQTDAFQQYDSQSGITALVHEETGYGTRMSVDVTNASGTSSNYRIVVVSYKETN